LCGHTLSVGCVSPPARAAAMAPSAVPPTSSGEDDSDSGASIADAHAPPAWATTAADATELHRLTAELASLRDGEAAAAAALSASAARERRAATAVAAQQVR